MIHSSACALRSLPPRRSAGTGVFSGCKDKGVCVCVCACAYMYMCLNPDVHSPLSSLPPSLPRHPEARAAAPDSSASKVCCTWVGAKNGYLPLFFLFVHTLVASPHIGVFFRHIGELLSHFRPLFHPPRFFPGTVGCTGARTRCGGCCLVLCGTFPCFLERKKCMTSTFLIT